MRTSLGPLEPKTPVVINFYNSGVIENAQVEAFIMTDHTVYYDISVKIDNGGDQPTFAKLQRIHSAYVWEPEEYAQYGVASKVVFK